MNISDGSIEACLVDVRKIYQGPLLANASSIILANNHPSDSTQPSQQDKKVTNEIKEAGEILKNKGAGSSYTFIWHQLQFC